jgi:hypothetical protein
LKVQPALAVADLPAGHGALDDGAEQVRASVHAHQAVAAIPGDAHLHSNSEVIASFQIEMRRTKKLTIRPALVVLVVYAEWQPAERLEPVLRGWHRRGVNFVVALR